MRMVEILNPDYSTAERVDVAPICGEDFCDRCGDCLHCYADDECGGDGGYHSWVVYADEVETFRVSHGL